MATLKTIRKRISSVRSTRKITKAMKMVAAARLKKAEDSARALRPYARRLDEIIHSLAARTDRTMFALLNTHGEVDRVRLVVLTSDKGLCGAFNSNVSKAADRFIRENREAIPNISVSVVGKKGKAYFERRAVPIDRYYHDVLTNLNFEKAELIGQDIVADYTRQELDAVYLVYNEYKSAISQKVVVEKLLPVEPVPVETLDTPVDYLYEPDQETVLTEILPLQVNVQVYRALLESAASEMGARMTAMGSATDNASDLIDRLTLQYNKVRQAAITKELMEIISGAEALKG
jgi:F-type H+-transporting ATPase subunit gamma